MTWEEAKKNIIEANAEDAQWDFSARHDRDLLQAFADELVKRMDAHYKAVHGDKFEGRFKETYVLALNIDKLLTECGARQ